MRRAPPPPLPPPFPPPPKDSPTHTHTHKRPPAPRARSLGSLSVRLCSPSLTPAAEARAAVAVVLSFLLREGVTSPVADAQRQCLRYLAAVAKVAGAALRPHVAELAGVCLASLSSFEPDALAYAQQASGALWRGGRRSLPPACVPRRRHPFARPSAVCGGRCQRPLLQPPAARAPLPRCPADVSAHTTRPRQRQRARPL